MKSGKLVKCLDNDFGRCCITPGQCYIILKEEDSYYVLKNDKNKISSYYKHRFKNANNTYELWR